MTSSRGNRYILAVVCNLTKFALLFAVKNVKTPTTVKRLEDFVIRFGAPGKLISDRGTSFTARGFSEFCNRHGIYHVFNSSRHPQANGLVERLNETILPAI